MSEIEGLNRLQRKYNEKIVDPAIRLGQVDRGLSSNEIQELFDLQALIDDSKDTPILLNSEEGKLPVVEIKNERLTLEAVYTISSDLSDPNNPNKRSMLVIKGSVGNGNDDYLSEEDLVDVKGDDAAIKRLHDAFGIGESGSLTVAIFLREMIAASLGDRVSINNLRLVDNELAIIVSKKPDGDSS